MKRFLFILGGLFLTGLMTGCSTYVDDYYFSPHPIHAELPAAQPNQPPPASALATIVGVRRADSKDGLPESVEVRFRLENTGPRSITFNPRSLTLSDGTFVRFPPPILQPPQDWVLPPGEMAVVTAYFPFLPGKSWDNTDLQSLELRWDLLVDGKPVRQVALFHRVYGAYYYLGPYYGYPYPYAFYGVGVGVGFHHRR